MVGERYGRTGWGYGRRELEWIIDKTSLKFRSVGFMGEFVIHYCLLVRELIACII